jgi:TonB family protein
MQFIERHKALIITALISSTIVLAAFNLSLIRKSKQIAESYYELEPETIEELTEQLEKIKALTASKNNTNEAFNNDSEYEKMMKDFKTIDMNDFEENAKQTESTETLETPAETLDDINNPSTENDEVSNDDVTAYNKVSEILALRSAKRRAEASSGNNASDKTGTFSSSNPNSNIQFSLKDRKMRNNPIPIYLCEVGGKIVVNITVDHLGRVTSTDINTAASSSTNECLTDHALEYAQKARFTSDAKKASQIGTVTFFFKGKQ